MTLSEYRLLLLDYCLHACPFETPTHSICREGLVGDVLKSSGNLYCILRSPRVDKTKGMAHIGLRKLPRTPTRSLRKARTVYSTDLRDNSNGKASDAVDLMTRMARIKQRDDLVSLGL